MLRALRRIFEDDVTPVECCRGENFRLFHRFFDEINGDLLHAHGLDSDNVIVFIQIEQDAWIAGNLLNGFEDILLREADVDAAASIIQFNGRRSLRLDAKCVMRGFFAHDFQYPVRILPSGSVVLWSVLKSSTISVSVRVPNFF